MAASTAFSSYLRGNVGSLDVGNQIKFASDENPLNGFDNSNGTYKAPVDGYYYLAFTVSHKNTNKSLTVSLLKGGKAIASTFVERASVGSSFQSGNQAVVLMKTGEVAQISIAGTNPAKDLVGGAERMTTFSGFKIA